MNKMTSNYTKPQMRLYDQENRRLYINADERERFIAAAQRQDFARKLFCMTLLYTGCRLSEGLALRAASVDTFSHLVSIRTLKKRNQHVVREVPIPPVLVGGLASLLQMRRHDQLLWHEQDQQVSRITGYRWIKAVMKDAGIVGAQGSPKGLRHGYGVYALRAGVPLNMLRKWMGHSSIETTAIYANAVGKEEIEIAGRMWGC